MPALKSEILELRGVVVDRQRFQLRVPLLSISEGEFVVVVGPSGSGKTTLLDVIAGRVHPSLGTVTIQGRDVSTAPAHVRPVHTCWQSGGETLFPHMSVGENAEFSLRAAGVAKDERRRRVEVMLEALGLGGFYSRKISQLSGGQRQRVAIVRALVGQVGLVLLDEITTGLDPELRSELQDQLLEIRRSRRLAMIYVSHDLEESASLLDRTNGRMVILRDGIVQQDGSWEELYRHPQSTFVAQYLGPANVFKGDLRAEGFYAAEVGRLPYGKRATSISSLWYGVRPEAVNIIAEDSDEEPFLRGNVRDVSVRRGIAEVSVQCNSCTVLVRMWGWPAGLKVGEWVGLRWDPAESFLMDN